MILEYLILAAFVLLTISMFFWRFFEGDIKGVLYWTVMMSFACSALTAFTLANGHHRE